MRPRDRGWRLAPPGRRHRTASQHASRAGTCGAGPRRRWRTSHPGTRAASSVIGSPRSSSRRAVERGSTGPTLPDAERASQAKPSWSWAPAPRLSCRADQANGRRPPSVTAPRLGPVSPGRCRQTVAVRALRASPTRASRSRHRKLSTSSTGRRDDRQPVSGPGRKRDHRDVDGGAIANVAGHAAVTAGDRRTVRSTQPGLLADVPAARGAAPPQRKIVTTLGAGLATLASASRSSRLNCRLGREAAETTLVEPEQLGALARAPGVHLLCRCGQPSSARGGADCQHQRRTFAVGPVRSTAVARLAAG